MSKKKGGYDALVGELELQPEKKAIALMYDRVRAPVVKAKGRGELADDRSQEPEPLPSQGLLRPHSDHSSPAHTRFTAEFAT